MRFGIRLCQAAGVAGMVLAAGCGPKSFADTGRQITQEILPGYQYQLTEDARPATSQIDSVPGSVTAMEDNGHVIYAASTDEPYEEVAKKLERIANGDREWEPFAASTELGIGLRTIDYRGYNILLEAQKEGDLTYIVFFITG